jgi:hypothetical protein
VDLGLFRIVDPERHPSTTLTPPAPGGLSKDRAFVDSEETASPELRDGHATGLFARPGKRRATRRRRHRRRGIADELISRRTRRTHHGRRQPEEARCLVRPTMIPTLVRDAPLRVLPDRHIVPRTANIGTHYLYHPAHGLFRSSDFAAT